MYWILIIFISVLSFGVSARFKNRFSKYSQISSTNGLSGKEIAERMLRDNGINDVTVISAEGMLTDNYNPLKKTVNLSADIYNGRSIAAMAVAAHECGHAVQHSKAYAWLKLRSALVPTVSFVSNILPWVLMLGVITITVFPFLLVAGVVMFAATTLFTLITLPVEFDASRRALAWLNMTNMAVGEEKEMTKDALKWAAMTYVVAAISSLAMLLYYASFLFGGRRD
jgi:Zn-dependent membrane protease YugP